jgi:hypothetical protein
MGTRERYKQKGASKELASYKPCRAPVLLVQCNPPWHGVVHVYMNDANEASAL